MTEFWVFGYNTLLTYDNPEILVHCIVCSYSNITTKPFPIPALESRVTVVGVTHIFEDILLIINIYFLFLVE